MISNITASPEANRPVHTSLETHEEQLVLSREPHRRATDAWVKGVRVTGHIVAAPLKIVISPVVGLTLGTTAGLAKGIVMGTTLPFLIGANACDENASPDAIQSNRYQRIFEKGIKVACYITAMAVTVPICAATGAVLGAGAGAVSGTAYGIKQGYDATWSGSVPSFNKYRPKEFYVGRRRIL